MKKEFSEKIVLEYMQEHLMERPSLAQAADDFKYSRNYFARLFTDEFGVPYTKFLTSLLMREAADRMTMGKVPIRELAPKFGFASSYHFSRAFKREIGKSPREYKKSDHSLPDMPPRRAVSGRRMFLNYIKTDDAQVYGFPVKAEHGIKTDLLKECAYHLDHSDQAFGKVESDVKISFWWSDTPDDMYYVLGQFDYISDHDEKMQKFEIPGSSYAVFSIERTGNDRGDLKAHREMVRYVMKDWVPMNRKKPDRMYYTYEVFDKAYTYLYLPLQADSISPDLITYMRELNIDNWMSYIDSRIEEDISVMDIAAHFHYSDTHFRRMFKLYFEMSPSEYIRKRRLYLAAAALASVRGSRKRDIIAAKYYFRTPEYFNKLFIQEFHMKPEDYKNIRIRAIDLAEYYTDQRDQVMVTLSYHEAFYITGPILVNKQPKLTRQGAVDADPDEQDDFDIPELASYWMVHDPDEIARAVTECRDKYAVWYSDETSTNYEYVVGYRLDDIAQGAGIPSDYKVIHIKAGKYAQFESVGQGDRNNMPETYRMLMRCAFYGWIKENRYRVDFERLTFVRYHEGKLYFFVPIHE